MVEKSSRAEAETRRSPATSGPVPRPAPIHVGIGGWTYPPWRGAFYPAGLPHARELEYAAQRLTSIEINATFHGSQKPESFARWRDATPDGFVFAVKGPRGATWRGDLGEAGPSIARLLTSGVTQLGAKLGPILWQLPANGAFDAERVAAFLALLPANHAGLPIRHAIEAAHPSFADPAFADLLRRHGVAWACVDADGYPAADTGTADFVYARLKRNDAAATDGYAARPLAAWRRRIAALAAAGQHCFVYFIAGDKARAPDAAQAFLRGLTKRQPPASAGVVQG